VFFGVTIMIIAILQAFGVRRLRDFRSSLSR
jgi:hypothetical protein